MPPVICTEELDNIQVGAGDTTGVTLQPRLTVPLNDPEGARSRLNFALFPAAMVCEVGDPLAGPRLKVAVVATPDKAMVWGLPGALSEMLIVPVSAPVLDGLKITEIWQLLPAAIAVPHVFVSSKF